MPEKPKKALIIQGGGFKTAFSAGVLDAFLASKHDPFDIYAGVSGGANALSYYLAGQYKSCIESIHVLLDDPKFINYKQLLNSRILMNVNFFEEIAKEIVQLNLDRLFEIHAHKKIGIVATNRTTGDPIYLTPTKEDWVSCLIASCTIPFVTKAKHTVYGNELMDGAWGDPVPIEWVVQQGARDITIVRTSPIETREKQSIPDYFGEVYYQKNPGLKKIFSNSHKRFNASIDFINNPPTGITIHQVAPLKKLKSGVYTNSKNALNIDYRYGLEVGLDYLNLPK
mgnify:CR=1 FL=1